MSKNYYFGGTGKKENNEIAKAQQTLKAKKFKALKKQVLQMQVKQLKTL